MYVTTNKSAKRAVLGLMLLLAGVAGMVTVQVDNDGDMETPAIVIETQMAAPVEKFAVVVPFESMMQQSPAAKITLRTEVAAVSERETASTPAIFAFPLVIPLRT